jgi:hypothetical protein
MNQDFLFTIEPRVSGGPPDLSRAPPEQKAAPVEALVEDYSYLLRTG